MWREMHNVRDMWWHVWRPKLNDGYGDAAQHTGTTDETDQSYGAPGSTGMRKTAEFFLIFFIS